jgi:hypothetical protein
MVLVLASQLWTSRPPEPPTAWLIAIDTSRSVTPTEFAQYHEIVREAVLCYLRPADSVVLLGVLDPDAAPEVLPLDPRPVQFERDVLAIDSRLRQIQRVRGPHRTDLGGVVSHAVGRVALDRALGARVVRYVLVIVSDGKPDGFQTRLRGGGALLDADWRLLFIGVRQGGEPALMEIARSAGFTAADRVRIVPFAFWRQVAGALGKFFGRSVNTRLVGTLSRAARGASRPAPEPDALARKERRWPCGRFS